MYEPIWLRTTLWAGTMCWCAWLPFSITFFYSLTHHSLQWSLEHTKLSPVPGPFACAVFLLEWDYSDPQKPPPLTYSLSSDYTSDYLPSSHMIPLPIYFYFVWLACEDLIWQGIEPGPLGESLESNPLGSLENLDIPPIFVCAQHSFRPDVKSCF